jgi:protein-tyrosine phosphatase
VIDLHCHALPGIDDGPADVDEAVTLARVAAEAGTRMIVATPHIDPYWAVDPASVAWRVADLQAALDAAGVDLELRTGGEVGLTRLPDLDEHELDILRLGGGSHVLLEAPLMPGSGDFEAAILAIMRRGQPVLLAHPERCPAFLKQPERYERLLEAGVLGQVTAGSFVGQFGHTIQKVVLRWAEEGWVHVVASDAHDGYKRPPGLRVPLERAGLPDELITWLTADVPGAIVANTPIPRRPEVVLRPRA